MNEHGLSQSGEHESEARTDGKLSSGNQAQPRHRTGVLIKEKPKTPIGKNKIKTTLDTAGVVRDDPLPSHELARIFLKKMKPYWPGAFMPVSEQIDWSKSPLVEINPRAQSGAPVLRGTRVPVSAIVDNFAHGVSPAEIAKQFQVPQDRVDAILAYAASHKPSHR